MHNVKQIVIDIAETTTNDNGHKVQPADVVEVTFKDGTKQRVSTNFNEMFGIEAKLGKHFAEDGMFRFMKGVFKLD